jgi:hypothetical protein
MWKWVKENAIDHGMLLEQARDVRPEWINEFFAARKTPFKRLTDEAWTRQANRRNIQTQAKHLVSSQNASLLERAFDGLIAGPRYVTTGAGFHSVVFPFTHAGALLLNPWKWRAFARLAIHTWKNLNPAEAEILRDTMARAPRFTLAKRSLLDLTTHGMETGGGKASARTWAALLETRFRLWNAAMDRHTTPEMSPENVESIGRELAVWANHATGSGKGLLTANKYLSSAFFGPKLTQSYWNRLVGDPVTMLNTFVNWKNASAGEKVVAMQRLKGGMTAATTYTAMLLANQQFLAATGQKDQINWGDPSQSDWLAFKWGGFHWGIPGAMHSEIKLIGQIVAAQMMKPDDFRKVGMMVPQGKVSESKMLSLRGEYIARQLLGYAENKATPLYGLGKEIVTGHGFTGRPLPWSSDKGDAKHPPESWGEYAWSRTPIPLSAGAGYIYDQLRNAGASVKDASMWMRAAMVSGVSALTGIEPKAVKDADPHRTRYGRAQVGH